MSKMKLERKRKGKYKKEISFSRGLEEGFKNYSKLPTDSLNQRLIFHLMPYYNRYLDFTNDISLIKEKLLPVLEKFELSNDLEKSFKQWETQNPRIICEKILDLIHTYH